MAECGLTVEGETGYCPTHLAELWGKPVQAVLHLIRSGRLDSQRVERKFDCALRNRIGFVPMGQILDYEVEVLGL